MYRVRCGTCGTAKTYSKTYFFPPSENNWNCDKCEEEGRKRVVLSGGMFEGDIPEVYVRYGEIPTLNTCDCPDCGVINTIDNLLRRESGGSTIQSDRAAGRKAEYVILDPLKIVEKKQSYDELYWKYVHAKPSEEYQLFTQLIDSVDLDMMSGDGSWVRSPDPAEIERLGKELEKLKRPVKISLWKAYGQLTVISRFWANTAIALSLYSFYLMHLVIGH